VNGMTGVKGSSQILADQFDRLDQGLAGLVSGGKADDAAKAFDKIKESADAQGVSVDDLKAKFPQYADAIAGAEAATKTAAAEGKNLDGSLTAAGASAEAAAKQSEEIEKALEDVGLAANGTVTDLGKFTEALTNAGLLQLSARDAARNWSQALLDMGLQADGTGGQLGVLGTAFDNTTEQGIKNQSMFDGVAQAGIANAKAMADNGSSQKDLQGNLTNTYKGLLAAAGQFGITGGQAEALARKVLGVPDGVTIQSWMSSEAKRMAEQTKAAIDNVPKNVTVNTTYNNYINEVHRRSQLPDLNGDASGSGRPGLATGGRVPGYADGGQLPATGPGTGMTDGFLGISSLGMPLARVDAGEWIINRGSSDRYNRELAAINAGTFPKLPGYANGGREYTAQSLGHGSYRATAAANVTYQIDAKPGLAYEYAKDIARQTAARTRDINAAYGI